MNVIFGDCIDVMRSIPDGSIDMVLADPPYGATACNWDVAIPFEPMWEQLKRITKAESVIVLMAAQPFTTLLIASNMHMFKYCMVWLKTKPTGYLNAKFKPLTVHEDIVVFGRAGCNYHPQMVLRDKPRVGKVKRTNRQVYVVGDGGTSEDAIVTYTHRYPTTVVRIPNANQRDKLHPTQKPVELMAYCIKTYSQPGNTVLDFCMGVGTTGVACKKTGRKFIGIENNKEYFAMAVERLSE